MADLWSTSTLIYLITRKSTQIRKIALEASQKRRQKSTQNPEDKDTLQQLALSHKASTLVTSQQLPASHSRSGSKDTIADTRETHVGQANEQGIPHLSGSFPSRQPLPSKQCIFGLLPDTDWHQLTPLRLGQATQRERSSERDSWSEASATVSEREGRKR